MELLFFYMPLFIRSCLQQTKVFILILNSSYHSFHASGKRKKEKGTFLISKVTDLDLQQSVIYAIKELIIVESRSDNQYFNAYFDFSKLEIYTSSDHYPVTTNISKNSVNVYIVDYSKSLKSL
jgi:hypothetical protein